MACTEMCVATESSSNNFIALRSMPDSRFGDTLYVEYQAGVLSVNLCTQPVLSVNLCTQSVLSVNLCTQSVLSVNLCTQPVQFADS